MSRQRQWPRRLCALALTAAMAVTLTGCGDPLGTPAGPSPTSVPTAPTPSRTTPTPSTPTPSTTATPSTTPSPATSTPTPTKPSPTTTTPTPTSKPSPTTTTPTPTSKPSPTTTPTQKPRTTLQIGDRGERVLRLQERLSDLGYWLGRPDGHFGGLTQQAVFAIQKAAGIGRDGVVGPKTQAALDAGTRPGSQVGGSGVEIDLSRQLLLIVRDGSVTRILNTSTGNGERYVSRGTEKTARTPTGTFSVYRLFDGLETGELGQLYRPAYFYRGWAVHGSTSIPPYPASHGCARVSNAAMDSIWANGLMRVGTTVTVYP